ncbi:MAG: Gfo/Idh/MocA family oxidoreductase [Pseudohongiella sp.]|nr:Gfo/Idh/MocA family oxidoreductase [Pseudohongiella sp.]
MIRIGVLGVASIAKRSVIPAIKALPELFVLTAVASRTLEKAIECAAQFQTKAFGSYEALINSGDIDAIYIPLPNSMHYEWVKKSLEKNIHVLVEKSLACTASEVEELVLLAQERNLVLLENFQFRFHRQLDALLELVNSKAIGDLRVMRASFGFPPFPDEGNIRYSNDLGGGALLDAAAYMMKISSLVLGTDIEVSSASLNFDLEKNLDTWGSGSIKHLSTPVTAQVAFGFDNFYQCGVELWGSKGRLTTNRLFTARPDYVPEIILETQAGTELIKIEVDDHFKNVLKYFAELIANPTDERIRSEYRANILQANLLYTFKKIANELPVNE